MSRQPSPLAGRARAFRSVGGYRDGISSADDWDLFLRLLLSGTDSSRRRCTNTGAGRRG